MTPYSGPVVFIVDDDEAVRDALAMMLRAGGRDVATFPSAEAFLDTPIECEIGCLVLDVRMPGMNGVELQEALIRRQSKLPIVFLTGHGDLPMAVGAVKRGAFDFVQKPIDDRKLLATIEAAIDSCLQSRAAVDRALPAVVDTLSRREREVLDRILAGRQTRAIAEQLGISIKTVEFHRRRIHEKLGVTSMAELFSLCLGRERAPPEGR